ncbi:LutC/YkgG family protein [Pullulanibacillus camelliae]
MQGTIQNREGFLNTIAERLGRQRKQSVNKPEWNDQPQFDVYKGATQDQLLDRFKQACEPVHTEVRETSVSELPNQLKETIMDYGSGSIVIGKDQRFVDFGLMPTLKPFDVHEWDIQLGQENIDKAAQANIGISFSDISLAESGTTVFLSDKHKARSINLLPYCSIVIVAKSTLVPRITQAMRIIDQRVKAGETIEPYINMISGPSNSADIEMNLVVGVHGPVKVVYLLVRDC